MDLAFLSHWIPTGDISLVWKRRFDSENYNLDSVLIARFVKKEQKSISDKNYWGFVMNLSKYDFDTISQQQLKYAGTFLVTGYINSE